MAVVGYFLFSYYIKLSNVLIGKVRRNYVNSQNLLYLNFHIS